MIVGRDPAACAECKIGIDRQLHVRAHADTEQDEVGREAGAIGEDDGRDCATLFFDRGDGPAELESHSVELELTMKRLGHLWVKEWHHLGQHLDERHFQPLAAELLGGLQADIAAADHDRAACARHGLGDTVSVLEVPQREHAARPGARDGRDEGSRAGRQDELVVALLEGAAGSQVPDRHDLGCAVDGEDLMARAHLDPKALLEQRRPCDEESLAVPDLAAKVVGQAAVREGDVGVPLEDDDACPLVHAPSARRGGGTARDPAHDEDGGAIGCRRSLRSWVGLLGRLGTRRGGHMGWRERYRARAATGDGAPAGHWDARDI